MSSIELGAEQPAYTDADWCAAADAIRDATGTVPREATVTAVLDAVAPAIAARALREAAHDGPLHFAATHTGRDARGWNVAEASWLRERADAIEASSRATDPGRHVCPECEQGKHGNCNGDAWDDGKDEPTTCTCGHGAAS